MMETFQRGTAAFSASKRELFTMDSGYSSMQTRLKGQLNIRSMSEELSLESLQGVRLWITIGPREKFRAPELEALRAYLDGGGNVMVFLGEGGEAKRQTNINSLLEELGIMVNSDAVVGNVFRGYFHPKEALVSDGVLNTSDSKALTFLYPYGATLKVTEPAVAVLSSGSECFPLHRPVLAFREGKGAGKLVVLGSCHMLSDRYIHEEENGRIMDFVLRWILTDSVCVTGADDEAPAGSDSTVMPDTRVLSEKLRLCLQHGAERSTEFTSLFATSPYSWSYLSLPAIVGGLTRPSCLRSSRPSSHLRSEICGFSSETPRSSPVKASWSCDASLSGSVND